MTSASKRIDHLVYATTDLDRGIAEIEQRLGVRAVAGGRHAAWGTHNALLSLGSRCYLEIIAPDPDAAAGASAPPFGLAGLGASRLATWVANGTNLQAVRDAAARQGVVLGDVLSGERQRLDGGVLRWTLTDPTCIVADGVVPFLIDWGQSPHPSQVTPQGATLVSLRAEHPDADRVQGMLRVLDLDVPVQWGSEPALIAQIDGPLGRVELR